MHLARELLADDRLRDAACLDEELEIDARADAHTFEHVHEILGG
jgi:hypothetical protein